MTYPWAAGEVLTAADLNAYAGLVYVTGGTVSGTTTLSVNNCFTSQFDNYRIVFSRMEVQTVGRAFRFRLRASGSDASGANYDYAFRGLTSGAASRDTNVAGSTFTEVGVYLDTYAATELGNSTVDIMSPAIAKYTYGLINANGWETAFFTRAGSFGHFVATAYDGFTVYLSGSGNMGFTWRVYGYNNG
jgi:hypothetical protein